MLPEIQSTRTQSALFFNIVIKNKIFNKLIKKETLNKCLGTEKNWPECRWGRRRQIEAGRNREGKAAIALWKKNNNKASYASPTHRLCSLSKFQSKQSNRNR